MPGCVPSLHVQYCMCMCMCMCRWWMRTALRDDHVLEAVADVHLAPPVGERPDPVRVAPADQAVASHRGHHGVASHAASHHGTHGLDQLGLEGLRGEVVAAAGLDGGGPAVEERRCEEVEHHLAVRPRVDMPQLLCGARKTVGRFGRGAVGTGCGPRGVRWRGRTLIISSCSCFVLTRLPLCASAMP